MPCRSGDGFYLIEEQDYQSQSSDPWLGRKLGDRYVVCSLLGSGSMNRVYKGYQNQVDRTVALKLFEASDVGASGEDTGPDSRDRFIREARVLAQLSHPNCVTLYDFGYAGNEDFLYIAMEHVVGISLRRAVRRGLKFEALVEVMRQVLQALREAHSLEIVHRDLKPENIILSHRQASDEQMVKVLDFGIAKLLSGGEIKKTRAGLLFGTPAYMSPEQCRGVTEVTPAADVYSLGCILFELVCGTLPFHADVPQEMIRQHQYEPVPTIQPRHGIELPEGFEAFIHRCLAKEPEDRFATAGQALGQFEAIVGGEARAGTIASGLDALDVDTRRVAVPETNLAGVELDPTGEFESPVQSQPSSVRVNTGRRQLQTPTEGGSPAPRASDTVRDARAGSSSKPAGGARRGGRTGLVVAAVLMVLLFTGLLVAFLYVTAGG